MSSESETMGNAPLSGAEFYLSFQCSGDRSKGLQQWDMFGSCFSVFRIKHAGPLTA